MSGGPETKLWRSSDKSAGEFTGGSTNINNLPLTLWLEGGGASSALRDVSIQYRYEVASHGNTSKDWAKATFLNVGTTVGCTPRPAPGGGVEYCSVANLNDSDNDGTVDKDDGYVNGDQDLISLTISNPTSGVTDGYLQLDVTGAVTVWKYPTKNSAEGLSDGELSGAALQWPLGSTTWPQTVYIEGTAAGEATAEVTYHPSSGRSVLFKTHDLVYFWATVEWEAYDNGQDANEALGNSTINGGKKIYPGKKTHNDAYTDDRRKVNVKATVAPARDQTEVHFVLYDVDDPSATAQPVDRTNDPPGTSGPLPLGGDNRALSGGLSAASVMTDGTGAASVILAVSMQPGDNYRVAAHPLYNDPIFNRGSYVDSVGFPNPKPGDDLGDLMPLTEMLTVWRKLHLEMDSMGAPGPEHIFDGDARLVGNSTYLSSTGLRDDNNDWVWIDHLTGGVVDPDIGVNPDTGDTVPDAFEITLSASTAMNCGANTYEGQYAGTDLATHGAKGERYAIELDDEPPGDIAAPQTQDLKTAFKECYIDVVEDLTAYCDDDVPFIRNYDQAGRHADGPIYRQTKDMEGASYWVGYALISYEGELERDDDPPSEFGVYGSCSSSEPEYAFVYVECIRDMILDFAPLTEAQAQTRELIHELGHQFELYVDPEPHPEDDSVMSASDKTGREFNGESIDRIRSCPFP